MVNGVVTLADLDINFLNHKIRQQIERISLSDENQVIGICGEDSITVLAIANHLARNWLPFTYDSALGDVHWCDPGEKGWLFENIETIIVDSLNIQPLSRHILIVQSCDTFTLRGWDKMLKILEDPLTEASFILCFSDISAIPSTIRGRVNDFIILDSENGGVHVDYLISCGYTPLNAEAAFKASQGIASLAMVLAKNYDNAVKVQEFWKTSESDFLDISFTKILEEVVLLWEDSAKSSLRKDSNHLAKVVFNVWLKLREEYLINTLHKSMTSRTRGKILKNINAEIENISKIKLLLRSNTAFSYLVSYYLYSRSKYLTSKDRSND